MYVDDYEAGVHSSDLLQGFTDQTNQDLDHLIEASSHTSPNAI